MNTKIVCELMDAHDVSPIVNSAKYDGPECIRPVSDDEIPKSEQLSLLQAIPKSPNHFIRPVKNRLGNCQADLLRGFEIDHKLKLGWLFDWQISRLGTLQYFIHVSGRATKILSITGCIRHEATGLDEITSLVH